MIITQMSYLLLTLLTFFILSTADKINALDMPKENSKQQLNQIKKIKFEKLIKIKNPNDLSSFISSLSPSEQKDLALFRHWEMDPISAYLQNSWCEVQSCLSQLKILWNVPSLAQIAIQHHREKNILFHTLMSYQREVSCFLIEKGFDLNDPVFDSSQTIYMSLQEVNPQWAKEIADKYKDKINWEQKDLWGRSAHSVDLEIK